MYASSKTYVSMQLPSYLSSLKFCFAMYIPTLLLISILQLIHSAPDGEKKLTSWNPNSALIQTQFSWPAEKVFPTVVRISYGTSKKVYFDKTEATQKITYAMCPNPQSKHPKKKYCNFGKGFVASNYQTKNLNEICPIPVKPVMEKVLTSYRKEHMSCASGGYRYKFVYYRCKEKKWRFLKKTFVYDACYNSVKKQLDYGYYAIAKPSLLSNPLLEDERAAKFEFQTEQYLDHFKEQFRVAAELYKKNPDYVERMVLPPEFLPFALMRKPLYHYMNVAPMDKSLLPAWELLMTNLGKKIAQMHEPVSITAGVLGVLKDDDKKEKYLGEITPESQSEDTPATPVPAIPIPRMWWLLIYDSGRRNGFVIMMSNQAIETSENEPYNDGKNCYNSVCREANVLTALPKNSEQYPAFFYCCKPHAVTEIYGFAGKNNILTFLD